MPRFDRLSATFKYEPDFQQVMGLFYTDILEFHRRAYKFFRRRCECIRLESSKYFNKIALIVYSVEDLLRCLMENL